MPPQAFTHPNMHLQALIHPNMPPLVLFIPHRPPLVISHMLPQALSHTNLPLQVRPFPRHNRASVNTSMRTDSVLHATNLVTQEGSAQLYRETPTTNTYEP